MLRLVAMKVRREQSPGTQEAEEAAEGKQAKPLLVKSQSRARKQKEIWERLARELRDGGRRILLDKAITQTLLI